MLDIITEGVCILCAHILPALRKYETRVAKKKDAPEKNMELFESILQSPEYLFSYSSDRDPI